MSSESFPNRKRRALALGAGALIGAVWIVAVWALAIPRVSVALDFAGWRQADTQAVARHMAEPGASLFYPRIDWGGDGPGYLESEFQLYTWFIARLDSWVHDGEWVGRALSSGAAAATATMMFAHFTARLGWLPALAGTLVLLSAPGVVFMGTLVQPDILAMAFFLGAFICLDGYAQTGERWRVFLYAATGGLAMLIKPTMVQIGVASFAYLVTTARHRLRRPEIWVAWTIMVSLLLAHYLHGRQLYETYGNSFGVLSGNDAKVPKPHHLLMPHLYLEAVMSARRWGSGNLGAFLLLLAAVFRRGQAATWCLFLGNAIWTLATLRYSTSPGGTNYVAVSSIVSAYAAAHLTRELAERRPRALLPASVLLGAACAFSFTRVASFRSWWGNEDPSVRRVAAASAELAKYAQEHDLVIVRSEHEQHDPFWDTANNINDPRVFYLTRTRGWGISVDGTRSETLESYFLRGARFYVDPFGVPEPPGVDAWLARRARLLTSTEFGGKVFALCANPGCTVREGSAP